MPFSGSPRVCSFFSSSCPSARAKNTASSFDVELGELRGDVVELGELSEVIEAAELMGES